MKIDYIKFCYLYALMKLIILVNFKFHIHNTIIPLCINT